MGIDKVNPGDPGGRPIPDKPRKPNNNINIYAILVGINSYAKEPAPAERKIPILDGCLEDVRQIREYLQNKYAEKDENGEFILTEETTFDANAGLEAAEQDANDIPFTYKQYGRLHLCELLDNQATYNNILHAFEKFFVEGPGTADDSFWFHFSGHGTEQFTAREFFRPQASNVFLPSLAVNGKDQTLVCFNPNGTLENILLADKELAMMIHRTYNQKVSVSEEKRPHIIVSLDCCHAGTGTRGPGLDPPPFKTRSTSVFDQIKARNWESSLNVVGAQRSLASYYQGRYLDMITEGEERDESKLTIPAAPHVLLAGSDSLEEAGDANFGGLFTTSLLDVLQKNPAINYADAFFQVRNLVEQTPKTHVQTPQMDALERFDLHTHFPEGWALEGNAGLFNLKHKSGKWHVQCGAINGLPVDSSETIELSILDASSRRTLGNAFVTSVGVQYSQLDLGFLLRQRRRVGTSSEGVPFGVNLNLPTASDSADSNGSDSDGNLAPPVPAPPPAPLILDPNKSYVAQIKKLPIDPFFIHDQVALEEELETYIANWEPAPGSSRTPGEMEAEVRELWRRLANLNIFFVNAEEAPGTTVRISNEGGNDLTMTDLEGNLLPHTLDKDGRYMEIFLQNIEKMAKWKRMMALDNPSSLLHDHFSAVIEISDQLRRQGSSLNFVYDSFPFGQITIEKPRAHYCTQVSSRPARDGNNRKIAFLPYRIRLDFANKPQTENLHYYLYNLSPDGSISILKTAEGLDEMRIENTARQDEALLTGLFAMSLLNDTPPIFETESAAVHKLLVTRQEIENPKLLEQENFEATRTGGGLPLEPMANEEDWCFLTLRVHFKATAAETEGS